MDQIAKFLVSIDWNGMLVPTLSIAEKILRTVLVYVFLIIALRIAGKREIAQLNNFDFVVLLMISNTVQNAIIGNDNSVVGGLTSAVTLLIVNFLILKFLFNHQKLDQMVEGKAEMLIWKGKLNETLLRKELITRQELEVAAHKQGIGDLAEVESAELDPEGELFFVQKTPPPEVSRHQEILAKLAELTAKIQELEVKLAKKI